MKVFFALWGRDLVPFLEGANALEVITDRRALRISGSRGLEEEFGNGICSGRVGAEHWEGSTLSDHSRSNRRGGGGALQKCAPFEMCL